MGKYTGEAVGSGRWAAATVRGQHVVSRCDQDAHTDDRGVRGGVGAKQNQRDRVFAQLGALGRHFEPEAAADGGDEVGLHATGEFDETLERVASLGVGPHPGQGVLGLHREERGTAEATAEAARHPRHALAVETRHAFGKLDQGRAANPANLETRIGRVDDTQLGCAGFGALGRPGGNLTQVFVGQHGEGGTPMSGWGSRFWLSNFFEISFGSRCAIARLSPGAAGFAPEGSAAKSD